MLKECFFFRMESSGRPDQVHVSEETCSFLGDSYFIEEGEEVDGELSKSLLVVVLRYILRRITFPEHPNY